MCQKHVETKVIINIMMPKQYVWSKIEHFDKT